MQQGKEGGLKGMTPTLDALNQNQFHNFSVFPDLKRPENSYLAIRKKHRETHQEPE